MKQGLTGDRLGPYRLLFRLGSGGDGEVWAAEEPVTARRVAVKALHSDPSEGRVGRLVREYQYLRELRVARVPRGRRLAQDEAGRHYLVMDFIRGEPASVWADRQGPVGEAARVGAVLALMGRAAAVLAEVHASGLAHGDMKPSCWLVDASDAAWLIDFGGSRPVDPGTLTRRLREVFMTPAYAAPEQLARQPATPASDVFGLATVTFRLLTGEAPYGRGTRHEIRARWEVTPVEHVLGRLAAAAPDLPGAAGEAIAAAFSADPAARPSAAAWAEAFRGVATSPTPAPPAPSAPVPPELDPGTAPVWAALAAAGAPVGAWALSIGTGLSPRRVAEALERLGPHLPAPSHAATVEAAGDVADALSLMPVGLPRLRALLAAGRHDDALVTFERLVDQLSARGRLAEALPYVAAFPDTLGRRLSLVRARVALAAPAPPTPGFVSDAPLRARWALARHFGAFDAPSVPASLGHAWRALLAFDPLAARSLAEAALDEAEGLREAAAAADALHLLARLDAAEGDLEAALRRSAEALDRWPWSVPGRCELVAFHARLWLALGAVSDARRLAEDDAAPATPVDRAWRLVALAEVELAVGHPAVAEDALAELQAAVDLRHFPVTAELPARVLALGLRLGAAQGEVPAGMDAASALVGRLVREQRPLHLPELASALAEARALAADLGGADEAADIALDAARATRDLPGEVLAWTAALAVSVRRGQPLEPPADLLTLARGAGLRGWLLRLELARGRGRAAWAHGRAILPLLDPGDAHALALLPWAVAAREARSESA